MVQLKLRFNERLRRRLERAAEKADRSMNAELREFATPGEIARILGIRVYHKQSGIDDVSQHRHLYHTRRWIRRRKAQLSRSPLCAYCQQQGIITLATVADHVVPHRGDANSFYHGELQSLCAGHHSMIKQQEEIKGYALAIGVDGVPIDPSHPANRGKM